MTNDSRSPEEIEREIEAERAGLTDTLDDLQDRFSVEGIARQFTDQFREHGGDMGRSVSEAVKRNPLALALTGAGLAWLMMGDRSPSNRDTYIGRSRQLDYDDPYRGDRVARRDAPTYGTGRDGVYGTEPLREDRTPPSRYSTQPRPAGSRYVDDTLPNWARTSDVDTYDRSSNEPGMTDRARSAAARGAQSVSDAGHSAADKTRSAGSSVAGAAGSAAGSVSDTAKGAAGAVSNSAKSAAGAVSDAGHATADGARNFASAAGDRAAAMRARLSEGTEHLSEEARVRVVAARERAVAARDSAYEYGRQGREKAADMFEEHPLIAGALALAVGAAFGAALPRSKVEDDYMGAQSDSLFDEAERIYNEESAKLGRVATAATDEAKRVANEVTAKADDAGESVTEAAVAKAKESGERIKDAAETEADKQDLGNVKKS